MTSTQWKGSDQQFKRLLVAIEHNCQCQPNKPMCPAHSLLTNQFQMDRFAFTDRTFTMYRDEEFNV